MASNTGKNIRSIRKKLNLSVKRFAELCGVSQATIVNIEQGHTGLKFLTIKKLIGFTDFSIHDIEKENFKIPKNLSELLYKKHKDNPAMRQYFLVKPKIIDAINGELLSSKFFLDWRETHEIVYFFENFGWKILGTSLQNELKKHPNVKMEPHPTKKGTFVYSKR